MTRTVPGVTFLNNPVYDNPPLPYMGISTGSLWEIKGFKKDPVNFPQSCPYKVRRLLYTGVYLYSTLVPTGKIPVEGKSIKA